MDDTKEILVGVVHDGQKVLILERTKHSTYDPGKWEFVSGFIKESDLVKQATECVTAETGLEVRLMKQGEPIKVDDGYGTWLIHPFLFKPESTVVKISKDHTGYAWVEPAQLSQYDCVKDLDKNLTALGLSVF